MKDCEFADKIVRAAMMEAKMPGWEVNVIDKAVRSCGWPTFRERNPKSLGEKEGRKYQVNALQKIRNHASRFACRHG